MSSFHLLLIAVTLVVPGIIFFASWWNRKHGWDEHGNPIEPQPSRQQHKQPESG